MRAAASSSIDPRRPAGSGQPQPPCPQRIRHPLPPRPHAPTCSPCAIDGGFALKQTFPIDDPAYLVGYTHAAPRVSFLQDQERRHPHSCSLADVRSGLVDATEGSRRRNSDRRVTTARRLLAYGPLPLPKAVSSPVAESCGPKERKNRGYATGLQDRTLVFGRALEDEVILLFDPAKVLFHVPDNLLDRRVG